MPWTHFTVRGSIPKQISFGRATTASATLQLELLLPQTHFVARGRILQRNSTGKLTSHPRFALDSPHIRIHVVIKNGIKLTFTMQRLGSYPQSSCGGKSDFAMSQNRHPFVDVQTPRGDGQPPATFKCCAEIASDTEVMCSTTAPQGMQGKTFVVKTEERKEARKIFPEIAWRHEHQMF